MVLNSARRTNYSTVVSHFVPRENSKKIASLHVTKFSRGLILLAILLLFSQQPINGQDNQSEAAPRQLTLYAAAEAVPALRYRLTGNFSDRIVGNAAVYYGKVTAEQMLLFNNSELAAAIDELQTMPLDQIRESKWAKQLGESTSSWFQQLQFASRCSHCEWQVPYREGVFWEILLPELQQTRSFARFLAVRARYQIAVGNFDGAIETIRVGLILAQHLYESPTIISSLVGAAIQGTMHEQLLTLIQQPDGPSLYWALQSLPTPIVGLRNGMMSERSALENSFPAIREIETTHAYTDAYWQSIVEKTIAFQMNQGFDESPSAMPTFTAAAWLFSSFPGAKAQLMAEGWSEAKVGSFSTWQIALIVDVRNYTKQFDDMIKWSFLPYHQAVIQWEKQQTQLRATKPGLFENMMLPAIEAIVRAQARAQRNVELLKTLESIRLNLGRDDHMLPTRLGDLTMPVENDPITGKSFEYERTSPQSGRLQAPSVPGYRFDYEITVGK